MNNAMDKIINSRQLLNTEQASSIVGVSPKTLTHWRSTKKENIPHYKVGGRVFYREEDLTVWLQGKRIA